MGTVQNTTQDSKGRVKKFSRGMINKTGGVIQGALDFYTRRSEHPDESYLRSALHSAPVTAMWMIAPGIAWGVTLGGMAYNGSKQLAEMGAMMPTQIAARYNKGGGIGGGFVDSEKGYTARQRGIDAIEQSRMNARSALGNEARSLHRR